MSICYNALGYFKTPFQKVKGMPIQAVGGYGIEGVIEVLPEYISARPFRYRGIFICICPLSPP